MRTRILPVLAVAGALALSACGGGGGSTSGDATGGDNGGGASAVSVKTTEYQFDPADLTIPADTAVTITVDNTGGVIEHDLTVEDQDITIHADPGKTTDGTVELAAGDYVIFCSIPGHRQAGMEGTLTVQ
jgi:plastocyanin